MSVKAQLQEHHGGNTLAAGPYRLVAAPGDTASGAGGGRGSGWRAFCCSSEESAAARFECVLACALRGRSKTDSVLYSWSEALRRLQGLPGLPYRATNRRDQSADIAHRWEEGITWQPAE